jgi:hypothetical protein
MWLSARSVISCPQPNIKPALGGAAIAPRRRHVLEVEDEGQHKNFDVSFVFVEVFSTVPVSFNVKVLFV